MWAPAPARLLQQLADDAKRQARGRGRPVMQKLWQAGPATTTTAGAVFVGFGHGSTRLLRENARSVPSQGCFWTKTDPTMDTETDTFTRLVFDWPVPHVCETYGRRPLTFKSVAVIPDIVLAGIGKPVWITCALVPDACAHPVDMVVDYPWKPRKLKELPQWHATPHADLHPQPQP